MIRSVQRIMAVVIKELRQLRRDRLTFAMIVGMPIMQLLLFGYAINIDVRHLSAGVADLSATSASREIVMDLEHSQVMDIKYQARDARELETLMRQGKISVGIYVPPDFERRLQQPDRAAVQLLIDGSDTVVQGAVAAVAQRSQGSQPPATYQPSTFENPDLLQPGTALSGEYRTRIDRRDPDHDQ